MKTRIYPNNQTEFFPLYAYTSNVNQFQKSVNRPDGYKMHQVFLISKGTGMLCIDGKTYYLEEDDLFYISANTAHSYAPIDKLFSTTYISFFGDDFEKIKKYYNLKNYAVYKKKSKGDFKTSVENLYDILDEAHDVPTLCSMTYGAIIVFFNEALKKQISPIEQVYSYLESNYQKNLSLTDILAFYPYSKAKLCRDFKEKYNVTIFEKLLSVRLRHAYQMIESNEDLPLKTIAYSCGFNDISYFCKMYKHKYNCSPKRKK